ncbi:hypothetical protein AKJ66_01175 [candidate division MSBL1 archaeon SCGC-AAA259E22]|uniref:Uncharacterized protein n=1 Tax=candidate division MSBL1 archaeon SCGC-AAA259E22 TaxID=1698265 RepID=A0A133UHX1_9EURY|nr:hypothetical protein AKJ66_01175 [candidate division MSBL1 archaeon SCGC-AAA259E22]
MKSFNESGKGVWRVSGDEDCPHGSTIMLGSDKGNNQYYQCQECGAVIIIEGESSPEQERERMEREKEEEKSGFDKFTEKLR